MKTMTCQQLGGPCDFRLQADTADARLNSGALDVRDLQHLVVTAEIIGESVGVSQHAFGVFIARHKVRRLDVSGNQDNLIEHPVSTGLQAIIGVVERLAQDIRPH